METSPIFNKTYDLMVWLIPTITSFPKDQRFRLAARIEMTMFNFYETILRASRERQPRQFLREADIELEKLRIYLRLAQDIRCLSFHQYEHASKLVNEVGKLLGGWLKSIPAIPVDTSTDSGEGRHKGWFLEQ